MKVTMAACKMTKVALRDGIPEKFYPKYTLKIARPIAHIFITHFIFIREWKTHRSTFGMELAFPSVRFESVVEFWNIIAIW